MSLITDLIWAGAGGVVGNKMTEAVDKTIKTATIPPGEEPPPDDNEVKRAIVDQSRLLRDLAQALNKNDLADIDTTISIPVYPSALTIPSFRPRRMHNMFFFPASGVTLFIEMPSVGHMTTGSLPQGWIQFDLPEGARISIPSGGSPQTALFRVSNSAIPNVAGSGVEDVFITNANANGQATMANSSPVVVASDQSPIPTGMTSSVGTISLQSGDSPNVALGGFAREYALIVLPSGIISANNTTFKRTPDTHKTGSATASGNTAVWTPQSGNVFHLMRYRIEVTANAAAAVAAVLTIQLQDGTTGLNFVHSVYIPSAAGTTFGPGYNSGWIDLGDFGYPSSSANNVLNVNLSFALTSGNVRVMAAGVEH